MLAKNDPYRNYRSEDGRTPLTAEQVFEILVKSGYSPKLVRACIQAQLELDNLQVLK